MRNYWVCTTTNVDIHGSTALTLPRLCLLLADVSVVLRVQLARPVEHRMCVAACRALRAVFVRAFVSTVTLRADAHLI